LASTPWEERRIERRILDERRGDQSWDWRASIDKLTRHTVLVGLAPLAFAGAVGLLLLLLLVLRGIFVAVIVAGLLPLVAFLVPAILVFCGLLVRVVVLLGLVAVSPDSRGYRAKE